MSLIKNKSLRQYYAGRIDGQCGPKTQSALAGFIADQRIPGHLVVRNSSPVIRRLSEVAGKTLKRKSTGTKPYLTFNGHKLCWVGRPYNGKCWNGVSGADGYQKPEHQSIRDKGPIPEGRWRVRQDRYQRYDDIPFQKKIWALFGRGTWPGGTVTWGENRIWLEPKTVINLYGRDNFSIHGGISPGSAGCIDLTSSMVNFTKVFKSYGMDLDLMVKYTQ